MSELQTIWLLEVDGECVGVFSSPEMAMEVAQGDASDLEWEQVTTVDLSVYPALPFRAVHEWQNRGTLEWFETTYLVSAMTLDERFLAIKRKPPTTS